MNGASVILGWGGCPRIAVAALVQCVKIFMMRHVEDSNFEWSALGCIEADIHFENNNILNSEK